MQRSIDAAEKFVKEIDTALELMCQSFQMAKQVQKLSRNHFEEISLYDYLCN